MTKLSSRERNSLPASDFADPPQRKLPIEDREHIRAAIGRFNQTKFANAAEREEAKRKIVVAADHAGIKIAARKRKSKNEI